MTIKKTLAALFIAITEEAERNEAFRSSIEQALGLNIPASAQKPRGAGERAERKGGRRAPAVLDPVELARQGEGVLREQLGSLTLDQLRDIVAEYGMDAGKLVMKWKDVERVRGRIVELALARAIKGDAFRS